MKLEKTITLKTGLIIQHYSHKNTTKIRIIEPKN